MKMKLPQACGVALLALSGLLLAGCEANGDGTIDGSDGLQTGDGDDNGNGIIDPNEFPNDGSVPTDVTDGAGGPAIPGNFICTASASGDKVTTSVGSRGVVGGALTALLNLLGADPVTQLTNGVADKDLLIDGKLSTHSTFTLAVGLLGSLLEGVDQNVELPAAAPAGTYAVFALGFPNGTVDLSLVNQIKISTTLNGADRESRSYTQSDLDLLGAGTHERAWVGFKSTQSFDKATITLEPGLLSANVGKAMYVHELCTGGKFKN
ncbi:hypothetical protein C3942_09860 [Solimonas fluminis]|uniref:DUF4382 domain-containing protein n=1 Tax=Solimonas fluminis TaxID=2086571 RepID=A0A2S5TH59_9GAMM|nr:hypothetical protein [Solimonas fluminis]PPE74323.1 hypothetical protein C3942_09860 [Solimonas fluminis]